MAPKKMAKDNKSRQLAFSRCKNEIFKVANELAILCAAQVAIVLFSPKGKPYSFGSPSVDAVSQRFLDQNSHVCEPEEKGGVCGFKEEFNHIMKQAQIEKKCGEELEHAINGGLSIFKSTKPTNQLNFEELSNVNIAVDELIEKVNVRITEIEASSSSRLNNATKKSDN